MEDLPDLTVRLTERDYTVRELIEIARRRIEDYNSHKTTGGMGDRVIVSVQRGHQEQ